MLNAGSKIQCHSQEDGTFKSDRTAIGAGCTLGVGALVHYGVTMGDGAVLAADSFLMKGEEVPPHARWGGNPARRWRHPADCRRTALRRQTRRRSRDETSGERTAVRTGTDGRVIETSREFWRGVLTAGGSTAIPRWTSTRYRASPSTGDRFPKTRWRRLRRLADELGVPLGRCCWPRTRRCLPRCPASARSRPATLPRPGRSAAALPADDRARLVAGVAAGRAARVESELLSHRDFPVGDLQARAGPGRAVVRDRVRPDGAVDPATDPPSGRDRAAGRDQAAGRAAGAAAAVPDRRARRRLRRAGSPAITSPRWR